MHEKLIAQSHPVSEIAGYKEFVESIQQVDISHVVELTKVPAMQLEALGVPSIAICTEPFTSGAKAMTLLGGMEGYPFAVVRHPIGSLTTMEIREKLPISPKKSGIRFS